MDLYQVSLNDYDEFMLSKSTSLIIIHLLLRPFDKDLWFRCHQMFMGCAVILTLIAMIIIIVDRGVAPWQAIGLNPHPIFGLICVLSAFIQPIMAMFRPHPGSDNRWIFNISHWFVGKYFLN